jgi:hypothetical protein
MNKSEEAIYDTQQRHLRGASDNDIPRTCERVDINCDTERSESHRLASRPSRIVREIPRRHTMNGYAFDA